MKQINYCPFRIHKERQLSATVEGEWTEVDGFMPCLKNKCPAFYVGFEEAIGGHGNKVATEKCKRL